MVKKNIITFQVSHIVIQHRMLRAIKKTSTDIDLLKMSIVSCAIGPDQPNLKNLIIKQEPYCKRGMIQFSSKQIYSPISKCTQHSLQIRDINIMVRTGFLIKHWDLKKKTSLIMPLFLKLFDSYKQVKLQILHIFKCTFFLFRLKI